VLHGEEDMRPAILDLFQNHAKGMNNSYFLVVKLVNGVIGFAHSIDAYESHQEGHRQHQANEDIETKFYGKVV
jgi:hypothetical protein